MLVRKDKTKIALLLASGILMQCPFSARAVSELDPACKLYIKGDAIAAIKIIDSVLQRDPKDCAAHYLKGNCLLMLKRLPEAQHEYAMVEHLACGSKMAEQARKACAQIEAAQLNQVKRSAKPEGGNHLPPGTIELIRKQAEQARERAIEAGKIEAEDEVRKADTQAKNEQERIERMATANRHQGDEQRVSAAELEILRSRAAANAEWLRKNGEAKAAWKEQEAQEKAENLQRQADELEEQLKNNDRTYKNRRVKLNPIGTNLYTRNYSSVKPTLKSLDAQAQTLPDASTFIGTHGKLTSSGTKMQRAIGSGGSLTETKVKGLVVK